MLTHNAFTRTFVAATAVSLVEWGMPIAFHIQTFPTGLWLGYCLLAIFGYLAIREGHGYRYVLSLTWAFVALWFLIGLLNFAPGIWPTDWPAEIKRSAFSGYLLSTALFLPLAAFSSLLGATIKILQLRRMREEPPTIA